MKKILLACSAGMSTSLLEQNMKNYIKDQNLELEVLALDSGSAKQRIEEFDVILLGPQVRFMKKQFEEVANGRPVDIIPMQMYGMVKGNEVVDFALSLLK